MKPRTLLVLAVLVLGLGAFIWFYEKRLPSSDERAEYAKKVFGQLEAKDITALGFEWDDHKVRLERQPPAAGKTGEKAGEGGAPETKPADEKWRLTAPLQVRADGVEVNRVLGTLTGLEKVRTLSDVDRSAVGLDKPRAKVVIETAQGARTLELGAEVPASHNLVAALTGEPDAYVVSSAIFTDATQDPDQWRDRVILGVPQEDVRRVTLLPEGAPAAAISLVRKEDSWELESPPGNRLDRADRELSSSLVNALSALRATKFEDSVPEPEAGTKEPRHGVLEVDIEGRKEPARVELLDSGKTPGSRYVRAEGQLFLAATRVLTEALDRPAADWRAKSWTDLQIYQIDAAKVKDAHGELDLERAGTDWKRGTETIPFGPVSDFLYAVTDAKADRVLTAAEAKHERRKLGEPTLTVTLQRKDKPDDVLTLYGGAGAGAAAEESSREGVVLLLPADRAKQIDDNLQKVREAKPVPEKKEAAAEGVKVDTETGNGEPPKPAPANDKPE